MERPGEGCRSNGAAGWIETVQPSSSSPWRIVSIAVRHVLQGLNFLRPCSSGKLRNRHASIILQSGDALINFV